MTVNPAGVVLLVVGFVCFIVGLRGSQAQTFAALTGRSSKGSSSANTSASVAIPGGTPMQTAVAGSAFVPLKR